MSVGTSQWAQAQLLTYLISHCLGFQGVSTLSGTGSTGLKVSSFEFLLLYIFHVRLQWLGYRLAISLVR
ncbi:hypothetical protein HD554DRAFT_2068730 [Boletus coccyginus]|nr:hypothetical protein HD554DRAFT_2068730 [Boletus coccyginus]